MQNQQNEKFMKVALDLAKKAYDQDEVPIGAVIVKEGKIIAKAFNTREKSKDATNHAEIIAIKKACKKLQDFRLIGCSLYVTLEPCLMCLGAILNARLDKIYYGASANKQNVLDIKTLVEHAELNHKCQIEGGILKEQCSALVSNYFKSKRNNRE